MTSIKTDITWKQHTTYNCHNCTLMAEHNTDPAKVNWIDIIDPRFSDFHCLDCCVRLAYDFNPTIMNVSAYLQQLKLRRLVERFGFSYELNESFQNIWFPEDEDGNVWTAYLGDHYADGTMVLVRMKVWALNLPEPVVYDNDEELDDEESDDEDGDNYNAVEMDDFVLPPQTPPTMAPLTVCPNAPRKPKNHGII